MFYIHTENSITVFFEDGPKTVDFTHVNWDLLTDAIKDEDWPRVRDLIDVEHAVSNYVSPSGRLRVEDNQVYFDNEVVHGALVERILQMMIDGYNVDPMVRFLENLMQNPSYRSRQGLYRFLEHCNLPITEDGCFVAYKMVTKDYKDLHSRTIDNSVGRIVEMPRGDVDDDPEHTCSAGLHFCSLEYLQGWGNRLMAVKINPKDVVAVPRDYNDSKGRCCRYEVIKELPSELVRGHQDAWDTPVYEEDEYDS